MSVANAFVFYTYHTKESLKQQYLIIKLVMEMIKQMGIESTMNLTALKKSSHLIVYSVTKANCKYCYDKTKKKSNTNYQRESCLVYLHPNCFKAYHMQ
jgi:hypothetical protein